MPSRWDIVDVDFGTPVGHEQAKLRPALIVSHDGLNHNADLATVCPITGARTKAKYPSEVEIPTLPGILDAGADGTADPYDLNQHSNQTRPRTACGPGPASACL